MNVAEASAVVGKVNDYLKSELWFDFEIMDYTGYRLVIMGSIDPCSHHTLEVWFDRVFFMSMPVEWTSDTSPPPFSLLTGEEARFFNVKFQVEIDNHIFRFAVAGQPESVGCIIGARSVGYRILPTSNAE